jgi:sulfoquinovosidase
MAGVAVVGVWIQDWPGKRQDAFGSRVLWNWEVDPQYYVDWGGMLRRLAERGVRVLTYINPYLATNVTNFRPHVRRDLFSEAEARGYLVRGSDGQPYVQASGSDSFTFGTVDVTNAAAARWLGEVIRCNMLCQCPPGERELGCGEGGPGEGVGGFMADFGEYLPADAVLWSGQAGDRGHNDFPREWAAAVSHAVSG